MLIFIGIGGVSNDDVNSNRCVLVVVVVVMLVVGSFRSANTKVTGVAMKSLTRSLCVLLDTYVLVTVAAATTVVVVVVVEVVVLWVA